MKSKAEDTEKDLEWGFGRPFEAGFWLSRGSSCSRESFREEDMPGDEVESVESLVLWEEEANEASSNESR